MKLIYAILIFLFFLNLANANEPIEEIDLKENSIILCWPSNKEIKTLKLKFGEANFYKMADDQAYYSYKITTQLEKISTKIIYSDKEQLKIHDCSGQTELFNKEKYKDKWLIISCQQGKQVVVMDYLEFLNKLLK